MKKFLILVLVLLSTLSISSAMDLLWLHPVPGGISCFKYSEDGKYYYTVGGDGYLRKWDAPTGVQVEEKKIPIAMPYSSVSVSLDGKNIVVLKIHTNKCEFYYWKTFEDTARVLEQYYTKNYAEYFLNFLSANIIILNDNNKVLLSFNFEYIAFSSEPNSHTMVTYQGSLIDVWKLDSAIKILTNRFIVSYLYQMMIKL